MKKLFLPTLVLLLFAFTTVNAENVAFVSHVADSLTEVDPYYIGVSSNPVLGGTTTGAGNYNNGETCILIATPNQGYTFANWTENGNPQTSNPVYSFTVTESRNLVANFTSLTYTISAYADPYIGGSVTGAGTYTFQEECTLTATANPGYVFSGWTENGANVSNNAIYTFTVTANRNLVATFVAQSFLISATANPTNAGVISGAGSYFYNQTCTLTATAKTGYNFVCWSENGVPVSNTATYTFTVTSSRNLVANFEPQNFIISAAVNPTNSGTVTGTGQYSYDQTCTLTATANPGYAFDSWTENGNPVSTNATYTFLVTGSRNIVANFTLESYEVSASANPTIGGSITGSGVFLYGQVCTMTATAAEGYTFLHWSDDDNQIISYNATYTFTVTGNRNLVANFSALMLDVTVSANPSQAGVVDGGGTYYLNQLCTVTAEANTGYTFVDWTENGVHMSSNATFEFAVTANRDLVANFTAKPYVISVNVAPENSGTVVGVGGYEYGQTCNLTASPNTGYVFRYWSENGTIISYDETYSFIVNGNRDLIAHFEKYQLQVDIQYDPLMGTVEGVGTYDYGEICTVVATANEHYHFLYWMENGVVVSTEAAYQFVITEDRLFVAFFAIDTYFINVTIYPEDAGNVIGLGDYEYGETVTLCIEANENYQFLNWIVNGVIVGDSTCYTFVVEGPVEIVANFEYWDAVDELGNSKIEVFPNPAKSSLRINGEGIRSFKVFNSCGQMMEMKDANGQSSIEFDVERYASGIYVLVLDTETGVSVRRFVKQ